MALLLYHLQIIYHEYIWQDVHSSLACQIVCFIPRENCNDIVAKSQMLWLLVQVDWDILVVSHSIYKVYYNPFSNITTFLKIQIVYILTFTQYYYTFRKVPIFSYLSYFVSPHPLASATTSTAAATTTAAAATTAAATTNSSSALMSKALSGFGSSTKKTNPIGAAVLAAAAAQESAAQQNSQQNSNRATAAVATGTMQL